MDNWQLPNRKTVVFLNKKEGYAYIQDSEFITNLTRLDVSLRMKKDFVGNDSINYKEEYLSFLEKQIKDWNGCDKIYLKKRLKKTSAILDSITPIVIPDTLFLIRTTGDQEFNAFYTVKKAIIFPGLIRTTSNVFPWLGYFSRFIEGLLIHETFHIFSRYHPEIRHRVYTLLGFDKIDHMNLHIELQNHLITNPDDHDNNYKICLQDSSLNEYADYKLLILSKYQTWIGYTDFPARINVLLEYLDSKLHPIQYINGSWESVLNQEDAPPGTS